MYPILFEFGIVTVFSLWFFVAIGFVAGCAVFIHHAKRYRVKLGILAENSFLLFFGTLLISRLTFILFHPDHYLYRFNFKSLGAFFAIWDKGLSFWGAIAALFLGLWYLARRKGESVLRIWDTLLPAVLFGMFFANLGAFLDGINYGTPTSLPWGMTFRSANVKYISDIHPTQLYSAMYVLLIAAVLLIILKNLRSSASEEPGLVTLAGVFLFSFFKFLEEFLRGDETVKIFSIRFPQLIAAASIIITGWLLIQKFRGKNFWLFLQTLLKRPARKIKTHQLAGSDHGKS